MPPTFPNPFRPGAGHPPPFLAGRRAEREVFENLLDQAPILDNPILTGPRGVGKTVFLESLKPLALERGWLWAGADLSETASISEERLAIRLCADLAVLTGDIEVGVAGKPAVGFATREADTGETGTFERLVALYQRTPGLPVDKIKRVLTVAWGAIRDADGEDADSGVRGIVIAYDEAQNLANRPDRDQYPLSLLIDAFQSLQRQGLPLMLTLSGLPTVFPSLVSARASAERMFRVLSLEKLDEEDSAEAVRRPLRGSPIGLTDETVAEIVRMSGGYPYFIQFICREVFDAFLQRRRSGGPSSVPAREIEQRLDDDFFSGRWARTTDRQRALLWVIAHLESRGSEFSVRAVVERSRTMLERPFSASHTNQMLAGLADRGLVFKNRHGRYSFAIPLFDRFIRRQPQPGTDD